jgi:hypothetical protein
MVCTCNSSYARSINGRIVIQASLGVKVRLYLTNNKNKKVWEHGLSGNVPA